MFLSLVPRPHPLTTTNFNNFTVVREVVLISQFPWSLLLLGNKPKKFDFTRPFLTGRCARAGHETTFPFCAVLYLMPTTN